MKNDISWDLHYNDIMQFMETQKRRPSKHYAEELPMFNWFKHQKKLMAKGKLKPERMERLKQMIDFAKPLVRINQYVYTSGKRTSYVNVKKEKKSQEEDCTMMIPNLFDDMENNTRDGQE